MKTRIADILKQKGSEVYDIEVGRTVVDVVNEMTERGVGCLLVRDGDRMVGIVSERDLVRDCMRVDVDIASTPVESVMTSPFAFITPNNSVAEALKVMSDIDGRHLPVYDGKKLVGIVALHDLLLWLTKELEVHVNYLESYIRAG